MAFSKKKKKKKTFLKKLQVTFEDEPVGEQFKGKWKNKQPLVYPKDAAA